MNIKISERHKKILTLSKLNNKIIMIIFFEKKNGLLERLKMSILNMKNDSYMTSECLTSLMKASYNTNNIFWAYADNKSIDAFWVKA